MANLTIPQLIKIIIGIFVVVIVVLGIFLFFKDTVIDFFKNLMGGEEEIPGEEIGGISQPSQFKQDDEEKINVKEECEASGCTDKPPEDLKCNARNNVKGYVYRCTRKGECDRRNRRRQVEKCDYGCTEKEPEGAKCNTCLPSGTVVYFVYSKRRLNRDWCCEGYSCSEKNFIGICIKYKCN